ncbi:MAG: XrtA/PEP-CTERM system TPR-repeat protein PrsT, partial [Methylococcales bacterium]
MNGYNIVLIALFVVFSVTIASCDLFSNLTDAEHVLRAKEFRDQGDLRATEIELKSALQKNSKNAEARWLLGLVNIQLGNGPAAEKELRRALDLGIAKQAVVEPLGKSLLLQRKFQEVLDEITADDVPDMEDQALLIVYRGDAWLGKGKAEKAKAEYNRALELNPQFALAKLGLARVAGAEKSNDKAMSLFEEALKISPQEASIWSYQAKLFSKMGDLGKAEDSYSKAIEYRKNSWDDILNRAYVRIQREDYDGAQADIDTLGGKLSGHYLTHYAKGLLYSTQKKYPEAQAALEKSLSLYGRHYPTLYLLGVSYLMQDNLTQADHYLSRFLRANPYSIKGSQMFALAKYRMRNYKEVKTALEPLLKSMPDDIFSLKLMAKAEFALGNSDRGLVHLNHIAEVQPDSPDSLMRLGVGRLSAGNREQGIQELEKALELDPQLVEAEVAIATAYIESKEFNKAKAAIERLQVKHPEDLVAENLAGMLFLETGEMERAKAAFESVL